MILTIGGIKGGTGKTTVATNLAIMRAKAGRDVLLVDADEQATSSVFTILRNQRMTALGQSCGYTAVRLLGRQVYDDGLKLVSKYEDIIIDTGGRDTRNQRAALAFSTCLLIPVQPRSFDLWSLEGENGEEGEDGKSARGTFDVVREMRPANPSLQVYTFINHGDHRGTDNRDTAEYLSKLTDTATFLDCTIGNRKSFGNAAALGLSVVEMGGVANARAVEEITALYRQVFKVPLELGVSFTPLPAMRPMAMAA